MNRYVWHMLFAVSLIALSVLSYLVQDLIFHRTEDTVFYMLQDLAFLPVQVLLVTFIFARMMSLREKRALMKKMNMLIGVFYSEVGTDLIKRCAKFSPDISLIAPHLLVTGLWGNADFLRAAKTLRGEATLLDSRKDDLSGLRDFLAGRHEFLLSLLANPNLLEHGRFTDLLWAVFHLSEELSSRPQLTALPEADYDHLTKDMKRAFTQVLSEWLIYMKHLKEDYPYLFSLAVRMNPLDPGASAIVRG